LGFRQLDLGEQDAAWKSFGEALRRDPATIELLRKHAQELLSQGRRDYAEVLRQHLSAPAGNQRGQSNSGN